MQETATATTIRRARGEDAGVIAALRTGLHDAGLECDAIPATADALAALLADPAAVITYALVDGRPIGLAYLERQMDGRVRVRFLGVRPDARRQGVGGSLLTHALFGALPASAIYLYLPVADPAAVRWAQERSFRPRPAAESHAPAGHIEYELRLDAPAHGCEDGTCGCGDSCAH